MARSMLEAIANKTVLEISELVKAMEEKFGVSAAAPVAVAALERATSRIMVGRGMTWSTTLFFLKWQ